MKNFLTFFCFISLTLTLTLTLANPISEKESKDSTETNVTHGGHELGGEHKPGDNFANNFS